MMCEGSHHSSFCQCRLIGFRSLAWNYLPRRKRVTHRGMITFRYERDLIGDSITTCLKVQKTAYRRPNGFKQCRNGSLISQNGNQILAPKRRRIVRFEGGNIRVFIRESYAVGPPNSKLWFTTSLWDHVRGAV